MPGERKRVCTNALARECTGDSPEGLDGVQAAPKRIQVIPIYRQPLVLGPHKAVVFPFHLLIQEKYKAHTHTHTERERERGREACV